MALAEQETDIEPATEKLPGPTKALKRLGTTLFRPAMKLIVKATKARAVQSSWMEPASFRNKHGSHRSSLVVNAVMRPSYREGKLQIMTSTFVSHKVAAVA